MTRCWVAGTPAPQGSKRHVGHGVLVESSEAVAPWREAVGFQFRQAMNGCGPLEGPLALAVTFYWKRPQSHYGKSWKIRPTAPVYVATRPDLDKLLRSTLDALTNCGGMHDDGQVAKINAQHLYVTTERPAPGALIDLRPLENQA